MRNSSTLEATDDIGRDNGHRQLLPFAKIKDNLAGIHVACFGKLSYGVPSPGVNTANFTQSVSQIWDIIVESKEFSNECGTVTSNM